MSAGVVAAAGGMRVWWADVPAAPQALEALEGSLTDRERTWAGRLRAGGARERFVAGRAALRRILAASLGCPPAEVALRTAQGGKPELASDAATRLHFSVSHSGAVVVVATAAFPVGVDVEGPRTLRDVLGLAARVLSPSERAWLEGARREDRARRFLELWTAKEAVLKAAGVGLPGLADVEIATGPSGLTSAVRAGGERWEVRTLEPRTGFVAAAAAATLPVRIAAVPLPW